MRSERVEKSGRGGKSPRLSAAGSRGRGRRGGVGDAFREQAPLGGVVAQGPIAVRDAGGNPRVTGVVGQERASQGATRRSIHAWRHPSRSARLGKPLPAGRGSPTARPRPPCASRATGEGQRQEQQCRQGAGREAPANGAAPAPSVAVARAGTALGDTAGSARSAASGRRARATGSTTRRRARPARAARATRPARATRATRPARPTGAARAIGGRRIGPPGGRAGRSARRNATVVGRAAAAASSGRASVAARVQAAAIRAAVSAAWARVRSAVRARIHAVGLGDAGDERFECIVVGRS